MKSVADSGVTTPVCHPFSNFKPETPTLPAYDTGRHVIVWCSYCRDWHSHGRGNGGSDGDGHRWAHCWSANSPYDKTGYFLRYAGPATPDILKDMKRRRPRGPEVLAVSTGGIER